jgi:SRSO17 transposase
VEQINHAAAAAVTVDHDGHAGLLDDLMARVAPCFARRETRLTCRGMVNGLQLSELDDYNCWTLAEAAGHASPCPMLHLLSRARCDDRAMLDAAADWTVEQLNGEQGGTGGDAILIVDETSDEKSSAAVRRRGPPVLRRHLGRCPVPCQVAVTLTYAVPAGHGLIGRALYLPADWAADGSAVSWPGYRTRSCSRPSPTWPASC